MAVFFDRVKDMTTTTGTGDITLSGTAPTGYRDFNSTIGIGNDFYYAIVNADESEWEVGTGQLSDAVTMLRSNIAASSNAGALVSFSAGTKTVFHTASAVTFDSFLNEIATMYLLLDGFNTDINTLQTDVGTLQTNVGTLQTDMTTAQADIVALQSAGSSLSTGKVEAMRLGAAML